MAFYLNQPMILESGARLDETIFVDPNDWSLPSNIADSPRGLRTPRGVIYVGPGVRDVKLKIKILGLGNAATDWDRFGSKPNTNTNSNMTVGVHLDDCLGVELDVEVEGMPAEGVLLESAHGVSGRIRGSRCDGILAGLNTYVGTPGRLSWTRNRYCDLIVDGGACWSAKAGRWKNTRGWEIRQSVARGEFEHSRLGVASWGDYTGTCKLVRPYDVTVAGQGNHIMVQGQRNGPPEFDQGMSPDTHAVLRRCHLRSQAGIGQDFNVVHLSYPGHTVVEDCQLYLPPAPLQILQLNVGATASVKGCYFDIGSPPFPMPSYPTQRIVRWDERRQLVNTDAEFVSENHWL